MEWIGRTVIVIDENHLDDLYNHPQLQRQHTDEL